MAQAKESACSAGAPGSILGLGRCPGEGNGYPLQYSCLGNPMNRGAWWAIVHGGRKESDMTERLTLNVPLMKLFYVTIIIMLLGKSIFHVLLKSLSIILNCKVVLTTFILGPFS